MPEYSTGWEANITCPLCGHTDHDWVDYPRDLDRDGDKAEHDCANCGATLTVTVSVQYEFSATALLDSPRKRPYTPPAITEWGTIQDLTKGSRNPHVDMPGLGGSAPT